MSEDSVSPQSSLEQTLKRCRPEVTRAALDYQKSKDPKLLPTIVVGVLERFIEPERRALLEGGNTHDLKLQADLGMDSLVMVEVVMTLEEVLGQSIPDTELRGLHTIGDTLAYVNAKATGSELPAPPDRLMPEMLPMMLSGQSVLLTDVILRASRAEGIYAGAEAASTQTLLAACDQLLSLWAQRKNETATGSFKPVATTLNIDTALPVQLRLEKMDAKWQAFYLQTGKAPASLAHL